MNRRITADPAVGSTRILYLNGSRSQGEIRIIFRRKQSLLVNENKGKIVSFIAPQIFPTISFAGKHGKNDRVLC
jgi:hypothetical protein